MSHPFDSIDITAYMDVLHVVGNVCITVLSAHRVHEGVGRDPPVHAEWRRLVHRVVEHLDRLQELARRHAADHRRKTVDQRHSCCHYFQEGVINR